MKSYFAQISKAVREICKGSGTISLLSIFIVTLILYISLTIILNRDLLFLVLGIKGMEDFPNKETYLSFLEMQHIDDELIVIVPIICSILLLIQPTNQLKSNIINRLLPINPSIRLVAFLLISLTITLTSSFTVYLFNESIIYYVKKLYLVEMRSLQEGMGDLYKNISASRILSQDTSSVYNLSFTRLVPIIYVSMTFSLLFLNTTLLFRRLSIIKGVVWLSAVILSGSILNRMMLSDTAPHINVVSDLSYWIRTGYILILLLCLSLSLFYILKERED